MAFTIKAVTEKSTINYYSGKKMIVRGFRVVHPSGALGRGFIQGTAQKWSVELEKSLQKQAEDFVNVLNEHFKPGMPM